MLACWKRAGFSVTSGMNGLSRIIASGFAIVLAILPARDVPAATAAARASGGGDYWSVQHWTTEDDLPQNSIQSLAQTPDGYLWIGTYSGLARFDGDRFKVFNVGNTPGMVSDSISKMCVDRSGTLWIGTSEGLLEWRGGLVKRWTQEPGATPRRSRSVEEIFECPQGGLWFRRGAQVCRLNDQKITEYGLGEGLLSLEARCIAVSRQGQLIVLTSGGLQRLGVDGRFEDVIRWPDGHVWDRLTELADGSVIAAARGAWARLSRADWTAALNQAAHAPTDPNGVMPRWVELNLTNGTFRSIRTIRTDRRDRLWGWSSANGLQIWTGEGFATVSLAPLSPSAGLKSILEDREGNVWIGTGLDGLIRLRPHRIRTWSAEDGLPGVIVNNITAGPDGTVWAATDDGVARWQAGRFRPLPGLDHSSVASIVFVSSQGRVWMAQHQYGVFEWVNGEYQPVEAIKNPHISAICEDRRGQVWLGPDYWADSGNGSVSRSPLWGHFAGTSVRAMVEDRAGRLWFGTRGGGAVIWDRTNFVTLRKTDGLCDDSPVSFYEDDDGAMWIGSQNGLNRFKGGQIARLQTQHGLRENLIHQVLGDKEGNLWLGGDRGIHRIRLRELNDVADGRLDSFRCSTYGEADGMIRSEINGGTSPSAVRTADGHLWFPTDFGLVEVDPVRLRECDIETPLVIEYVRSHGEVLFDRDNAIGTSRDAGPLGELTLPPGGGDLIEIRFAAPAFLAPEKLRFQYRFESHDQGWIDLDRQRLVVLRGLGPGDYGVQLRVRDAHGRWSERPASLAITIRPHLWERAWFLPMTLVLAVGIVGGLAVNRIRWQRQVLNARHAGMLAEERTRIARDLHDDLGTALTGVALEMELTRNQAGAEVARRIGETAAGVRALVQRMREVVWAVNPACDDVASLATFIEEQARTVLEAGGLNVHIRFPEKLPDTNLDCETRYQLSLSLREAITNILRHAGAKEVTIRLDLHPAALVVVVQDDGRGFDLNAVGDRRGHGLEHMRARVNQIGGRFEIQSRAGCGTTVTFRVPLPETDQEKIP